MENKNSFIQGGILGPLVKFTFPVLFALILQSMYGAIDLLVVGRFGAAADVSAVSTGSQIMHTITAIMVGLSMGTTVLLGQSIGRRDLKAAGDTVGAGICLFTALGTLVTIVMLIAGNALVGIMQTPAEAFDPACDYVLVCSAGTLFIIAYNLLGGVFRGMGDSRTPLIAVAIACAANILLDLLFVAVFGMGAMGAALATVLAQAISVGISFILIRRRGLIFPFSAKQLRFDIGIIKETLRMGIPIALQDFLVSISFLVLLAIVNSLGLIISAGVGVAEKLTSFIMLVPSAFMQSMSAFVAQNIGANQPGRAKKALLYGMATSFGVDVIMAAAAIFFGDRLASIFTSDPAVIEAAALYLMSYGIDTLLVSFLFCFSGYFNGCGRTTFVMAQGIVGAFCVRIPVAFIMSRIPGISVFFIGLATPCSTIVQIALCVWYYLRTEKRSRLSRT
ncbi:MAG: MATE family efflux transporter [Clostridia bacterium]|nr:MATE family efflux transporter [Clostridia bacterium]